MSDADPSAVPRALRAWFVLHCVVDLLVATPLFAAPEAVLGWLGWERVDPLAARLVAAALFGIGLESWLGRNAGREAFRGMLNLKIVWSLFATLGIGVSIPDGPYRLPLVPWAILALFLAFHGVWIYWRLALRRRRDS